MKKILLLILSVFAVVILTQACANNTPAGPAMTPTITPTFTITPTLTATPWATISIQALLRGQDNAGTAGTNPLPLAWCDIYVSEDSTPCPNATVFVNLTPVPQNTPGKYSLGTTAGYFAAGQTAIVQVIINGVEFNGSAVYPGGQTFTAADKTVSWLYEGSKDIVAVYDPINAEIFSTGSGYNANSPVVLSPSLFSAPGTYSVRMYAWDRKTGVFSGPCTSAGSYIEMLGYNFMSYVQP